jgi:Organic radical activating enzymes
MTPPAKLELCELFRSLCGETSQVGRPATFVRLSGCNLRCRWCDTQKAWQPGVWRPLPWVTERVIAQGDSLVVVTGGEPLLQPACMNLCQALLQAGREVLVETNGSLDISSLPRGVRVIMDMKPPGSGEVERMDFNNLQRLKPTDELKVVMSDRNDFNWAVELLNTHPLPNGIEILFSPAAGRLDPGELARWILTAQLPVRLQIQLHKIVFPSGCDGVPILDGSVESQ